MSYIVEEIVGGRTLSLEVGQLAGLARSAVTVRYSDTTVLVTVCSTRPPWPKGNFLPLTVDYEERLYAAGKIPGGFLRREGRPTQEAVLAARRIDRPIRPLFPKGFYDEIQVIATVLSTDQENTPEVSAIVGASAALHLSGLPFDGPIGAVRVGYMNGEYVVNPTFSELQDSLIDLIVVSKKDSIVMVEACSKESPEDIILEGIKVGMEANLRIIEMQERLQDLCGNPPEELIPSIVEANPEVASAVADIIGDRIVIALGKNKPLREEEFRDLKEELLAKLADTYPVEDVMHNFDSQVKAEVRFNILKKGLRPDGRLLGEIRPITCEVGLLPRAHGSGLFQRGQTQVLTITTVGSLQEEQPLDGLTLEEHKRFMHHYNFPPFSTGEVKRLGSPGRREIGHGALVERAMLPVIPPKEEFPYAIRLVSEVLSSNGSSSMASVCGSTLSLMDAGVPILAPIAGVAMGVIVGEEGEYAILTDIAGLEDAYGNMDFKVAGTAKGITAIQLDIKLKGISENIIREALYQAREARLYILTKMQEVIASSRPELSRYAPRITKMTIDPSKIGAVIGPGGKMIRSIIEETKATIKVENDGTIYIGSSSDEAAQRAVDRIKALTKEIEVGAVYTGKVTQLANFGAFVEILPGKDGLVHISELADYRVPKVEDVVKIGDEIMVKVIGIDHMGKVSLSHRAVLEGSSDKREYHRTNNDNVGGRGPHINPTPHQGYNNARFTPRGNQGRPSSG